MAQRRRVVHRFCVLFNVSINRIFIHERKDELHFSLTGPSTRKSVTTAASRCTATNLHLYENFCRHIHPPQTSYYPIMWHTQILACLFNRKPIYCTSCRLANFTQILRKEKFLLPTSSTRKLFSNHHVFFQSKNVCMFIYEKFVVHSHLPLLVSRRKFFLKSNSQPDVSWHPLSMTDVSDLRHESPNLLEIIFRSGSQIPSFTYPSDMVCVDPDVGDGVLWTRGRLSSEARSKPMVNRFTC